MSAYQEIKNARKQRATKNKSGQTRDNLPLESLTKQLTSPFFGGDVKLRVQLLKTACNSGPKLALNSHKSFQLLENSTE